PDGLRLGGRGLRRGLDPRRSTAGGARPPPPPRARPPHPLLRHTAPGARPHSVLCTFGATVRAAQAFDRHIDPDVPRIVLVDTFKDEAEESLRVADELGDRLWGVRLDTPAQPA